MVACAAQFYNSPVTHANREKCLKVMLTLSEEACRAKTETTYQPLPLTIFELSRFLRNGISQRYSFAPFLRDQMLLPSHEILFQVAVPPKRKVNAERRPWEVS